MSVIGILHQLLLFVRQGTPYLVDKLGFARAQVTKIRTRFGEAQSAVRPTAYFISIMVILTIIFPETNLTNFVVPSPM